MKKLVSVLVVIVGLATCLGRGPDEKPLDKLSAQILLRSTDTGFVLCLLDDYRPGVNLYRVDLFLSSQPETVGHILEGKVLKVSHPQAAEILRKTKTLPVILIRVPKRPEPIKRKKYQNLT